MNLSFSGLPEGHCEREHRERGERTREKAQPEFLLAFFSPLLGSVSSKQRYQGCCQGKAVQTSSPSPPTPAPQGFCSRKLAPSFPCRHWQFSHGYKILHRPKGQHEKIIDYLHERVLKSFSKENETQILFHVPSAEISAAVAGCQLLTSWAASQRAKRVSHLGIQARQAGSTKRKHQQQL